MIDDDYTLDEGCNQMPGGWRRRGGRIPLTVRQERSNIPVLPHIAFGPQISGRVLSVYRPCYLDLGHLTRRDAVRPWQTTGERRRSTSYATRTRTRSAPSSAATDPTRCGRRCA
ncbi:hypothetical protein [Virgisporangium aurantiacum]|uniref:Uncharacterized protein n=1 Tax=Virgisporangium aurantiacum TaxID=175570 RepID=A0A8J4E7Z7_9ACTN|nr:hypothetical protein [Virgisporangium aurantiacum]GIJ64839.1 hypothetical protein Vau01_123550 [Virgisporangium aurantiacum]